MSDRRALSDERLRALRVAAQQLHRPEPALSPSALVERLCGVQAQAIDAAALAVRARTAGATQADVAHARVRERTLVRTWAMRGTLHLVAAPDVGWLLPLLAPVCVPAASRRLAQLGVDRDAGGKAVRLIGELLADEGPLTRAQIARALARRGIRTDGQRAYHLVRLAGLEGIACMGCDRDGEPTFVLVRDWIASETALPREDALAELARRYLAAYGPAEPGDMARWSGLSVAEARAGWRKIAGDLLTVDVGGRTAWMLRSHGSPEPPHPAVRLLPSFDPYLLAYRRRDFALSPQYASAVNRGGGWLHPIVVSDGRVVGTWSAERRKARLFVTVRAFARLAGRIEAMLDAEAEDVARFVGVTAELAIQDRPVDSGKRAP